METNSVNRNTIDWPTFRTTVLAEAPDPAHLGDTFGAIHTAIGLLGDNHSRYVAPLEYGVTITNSKITCIAPIVSDRSVPADIGFVHVRGFSGTAAQATSFASSLQEQIRFRDIAGEVVGWIVDLRGNLGGNMWPMIAGVGPILGEGTVGYFVTPNDVWTTWEYSGGASKAGGATAQSVTNPYTLRRPDPRVAVLIDGNVASSGEAVAIAFRARPNTRFFGSPTCGLSTAVTSFSIDGATLGLTVAKMADRTRFVYGDTLLPDEAISNATNQVERAIAWLREPMARSAPQIKYPVVKSIAQ